MVKKDIEKIVTVPENVQIEIKGNEVTVKSAGKETKKVFDFRNISVKKEGNEIKITAKKATKRESTKVGTLVAHLNNMMKGFSEEYVYKLEICNVHFPMTVKAEGSKVIVKTFLGEVDDRIAKVVPGVKVEVKGTVITVSSHDKEAAGQTAANIEKSTKITGRDRRVFQDGIFITEKCGRAI